MREASAGATVKESALPPVSFVVIGRNEGPRLVRCLESLRALDYPPDRVEIIYVDSRSTDDSCALAEPLADRVLAITPTHLTAAAGRNAGLRVARHDLVHFVDGDTCMHPQWLRRAVGAMDDPAVLAVFGRVEEVAPEASVYNFWAHHDWYRPPGPVDSAGGIALYRRELVERAGGFDEVLIAGEEPDLCARMRARQDGVILCLDEPMVRHDMNMTRFSQYWRRCMRTGHAYAQVAERHRTMHAWRKARWRNLAHASAGPIAVALSLGFWTWWPLAIWAALIIVAVLRNAWRVRGRVGALRGALLYSLHHYLAKTPMALGQCRYWFSALTGYRPQTLIEHRV